MACFLVPATEAVVTTIISKVMKKEPSKDGRLRLSDKLRWLNGMLWGGSALLAFEHIWHGEVVPYFPFLTNAADAFDRAEMLHEMATAGVGMALLVTAVWIGIVLITSRLEKMELPRQNAAQLPEKQV